MFNKFLQVDARNNYIDNYLKAMSKNLEQILTEESFDKLDKDSGSDNNEAEALPIRRATRARTKPKKYSDFLETSPVKRMSRIDNNPSDGEDSQMDVCSQKPTALFDEDDIGGQDIFKFKSRHTKHDLQNKVKSAVTSSLLSVSPLKTPKKSRASLRTAEATPRHVSDVMKKRIIREVESDSAESDFSGSSDDFVPDNSDDESEPSASSNSEEEEHEEISKNTSKQRIVKSKADKMKHKDSEYFVTPDNYFVMHSSKKITTSDHTLARLKNMNISENMKETEAHISNEHQSKIINLVQSYEQLFNRWLYLLSEDFNIILYGIGSKRSIVNRFQMQKLLDMPCIVINGFFPSLTIKNILETIVIDLLENSSVPSNIGDVINLIDSQLSETDTQLFLFIHNVDGPMLRNAKAQSVLASLSQLKNVHTIATIDHINAPLLWDHSKLSKFKFTWWDATTFLPYTEETSYENSLMTQRSGALQLSSLKSVYQSLTTNAKGIFNIIIEYQLENQKQAHYQGLPFRDLYSKAREQFLVSSDLALRAQLTEFLDHKLAKIKRSCDGSENLVIPIESTLLQQFLEQNS